MFLFFYLAESKIEDQPEGFKLNLLRNPSTSSNRCASQVHRETAVQSEFTVQNEDSAFRVYRKHIIIGTLAMISISKWHQT